MTNFRSGPKDGGRSIPTLILATALPFSKKASAQQTTDYSTQTHINFSATGLAKTALTKEAVFNPFFRPNAISTISYGDGDVDNDGDTDIDDYNLMVSGTKNDQSDVDGDGIPSTQSDISILESHLYQGTTRPGDWNNLKTPEERINWFEKMVVIDKTNEIPPQENGIWDCHDSSIQRGFNFYGYENEENPYIPSEYNLEHLGRFNLPLLHVYIIGSPAHEAGAILIGDNPLNFNDWYFSESQTDEKINIGDWNMPKESKGVNIGPIINFSETGSYKILHLVQFDIQPQEPQVLDYDENLLLTRPDNPVFVENQNNPKGYSLNQNFPNPFNPTTTIGFTLPEAGYINLTIHNVGGQKIETLVDGNYAAGNHTITWDASNNPSGIYFSRFRGQSFDNSRKMILVR